MFLINGAVLLGCAVLVFAWRDTLLTAFMLLLPFIDPAWSAPGLAAYRHRVAQWSLLIGVLLVIVVANPGSLNILLFTLFLVALPEEWFFRAYFLRRLASVCGNRGVANIATSALFTLMHAPTQGWFSVTVFVPSLFLGWVYQSQRDIVLVILIHTLLNMVYFEYLSDGLLATVSRLF